MPATGPNQLVRAEPEGDFVFARIPRELWYAIKDHARTNGAGRSATQELVQRLRDSFVVPEPAPAPRARRGR